MTLRLHPYFFTLIPLLLAYLPGVAKMPLPDFMLALSALLLLVFILAQLFTWIYKNPQKGSLAASAVILGLFCFGYVLNYGYALKARHMMSFSQDRLYLLWGLLFAGILSGLWFVRLLPDFVTSACNIASVALVAVLTLVYVPSVMPWQAPTARQNLPDIYYIVLDAYDREDMLSRYYGFSNQPFLDALRQRGFYIADKSCTNYAIGVFSLASSLNLDYLNKLPMPTPQTATDYNAVGSLITDNRAARLLKAKGYRYIQINSWNTVSGPLADLSFSVPQEDKLLTRLLTQSILAPSFRKSSTPQPLQQRRHILNSLAALRQVPAMRGPKFVFAHLVSPHPPFLFDANGNFPPQPKKKRNQWPRVKEYTAQVAFINGQLLQIVDGILSSAAHTEPGRPAPVIIIQGNHGTKFSGYLGEATWPTPFVRERSSILNAYYVAPALRRFLTPDITPVNTFRFILDHYLQYHLPYLNNQIWFQSTLNPYRLKDVTDQTDCAFAK